METKYTTVFVLAVLLLGTPANAWTWDDVWCYGGAIAAGAGAVAFAPVAVGALGFGAGIAAGSTAAGMMSASAIASGGGVAAGGVVATLQSVGAAGLGLGGKAAVGTVAAAVYQTVAGGCNNKNC